MNPTFLTVEFAGNVIVDLKVYKGSKEIFSKKYMGRYSEDSILGYVGTWQRVMNKALERSVIEISKDPNLIRALKSAS